MKGYIIYGTDGALVHHGVHHDLPECGGGLTIRELPPEVAARIPPARGRLFVSPPAVVMIGDVELGKFGDAFLLDRPIEAGQPANPESALESAIRENTTAVKAMTDRLDRLFSR